MERSRGEKSASDVDELRYVIRSIYLDMKDNAYPIRTKSCIMNLCNAFVGCVMYTLPFPSRKFVCSKY